MDQGAPLSPAIFAAGVRQTLDTIHADLNNAATSLNISTNNVHVIAYLDDVMIGVPPPMAHLVVDIAERHLNAVGLQLNTTKTKVWAATAPPNETLAMLMEQDMWCPDGFKILGTPTAGCKEIPVGTSSFAETFYKKKVAEGEEAIRGLTQLSELVVSDWPGAQIATILLRQCANKQLIHLLRTTPPDQIRPLLAPFDDAVAAAAIAIMTLDDLSTTDRAQLHTSLRNGGFGLPAMQDLADPAWVGSWLLTLNDVITLGGPTLAGLATNPSALTTSLRLAEANLASKGVDLWAKVTRENGSWAAAAQSTIPKGQHHLQLAQERAALARPLQQMPEHDAARLRSCGGPGAAAWLTVTPTTPDLTLPDSLYRIACRVRMGHQVIGTNVTCQNIDRNGVTCKHVFDQQGDHAHTCKRGKNIHKRHDNQRRMISKILRENRIGAEEEVRVPEWDRVNRSGYVKRAVLDIRVEGGPGGPVKYIDTRVTHPTGGTNQTIAAATNGAAALRSEQSKITRYSSDVIPLVCETYGRWGARATRWWRDLARQAAEADPQLRSHERLATAGLLSHWWGRTSVALQRANAEAVLSAKGHFNDKEESPDTERDSPAGEEFLIPEGE